MGANQPIPFGGSGLSLVAIGDCSVPVHPSDNTLDEETLDVADWRGLVVVVNVWGRGVAPVARRLPARPRCTRPRDRCRSSSSGSTSGTVAPLPSPSSVGPESAIPASSMKTE